MSGATRSPCADLTTLSSGNHTFYVHGQDANGWGAVASAVLNLDKAGPAISNMSLTPSADNGTVDVVLQATASDVATRQPERDGGRVHSSTAARQHVRRFTVAPGDDREPERHDPRRNGERP